MNMRRQYGIVGFFEAPGVEWPMFMRKNRAWAEGAGVRKICGVSPLNV
jgi:hypothetical protein